MFFSAPYCEVGSCHPIRRRERRRHHVVFCAGLADDLGAAGAVVVVRVADEQDLDVAEAEAESTSTLLRISGGDRLRGLLLMRMRPLGVAMR
jgi:hypothetical protein